MYPTINVSLLNQAQGPATEIERHLLFIGSCPAASEKNVLLNANTQTDFDQLLGAADSALKTQLQAAMLNGGQNWTAGVWALDADTTWEQAARLAQKTGSFEGIVYCDPVSDKASLTQAQSLHSELVAKWARWSFVMLNLRGLLTEEVSSKSSKAAPVTETWAQYLAAMTALQDGVKAEAVMLIPPTHGNNLGCLAGRLCNRSVTVADSPMRVKTGALVGLGAPVKDSEGQEVDSATLQAMEKSRLNVIATFPDYDGVYWADGRTLDAEGGDFQVIEHLRVLMKAARRVRLLAIPSIADRSVNSSPSSMAAAKSQFAAPLREMAKSTTIAGTPFPGEIQPPGDDAITLNWLSHEHLQLFVKATPWNSPKAISIGVMLYLSH